MTTLKIIHTMTQDQVVAVLTEVDDFLIEKEIARRNLNRLSDIDETELTEELESRGLTVLESDDHDAMEEEVLELNDAANIVTDIIDDLYGAMVVKDEVTKNQLLAKLIYVTLEKVV